MGDFIDALNGLSWPAALVIAAFILGVAWVLVAFNKDEK